MIMSYYVLDTDGINTQIVIRVPAPNGKNTVETPWRRVLAERWANLDPEARVSHYPGRGTAALVDGSEFEIRFTFRRNVDRPGIVAELEAAIDAKILTEKQQIAKTFAFWGKEG